MRGNDCEALRWQCVFHQVTRRPPHTCVPGQEGERLLAGVNCEKEKTREKQGMVLYVYLWFLCLYLPGRFFFTLSRALFLNCSLCLFIRSKMRGIMYFTTKCSLLCLVHIWIFLFARAIQQTIQIHHAVCAKISVSAVPSVPALFPLSCPAFKSNMGALKKIAFLKGEKKTINWNIFVTPE